MADGFAYENYFSAHEVAVFKMVKHGQMILAGIVREELAELVGGSLSHDRDGDQEHGKEFLHTDVGTFRVALRSNSDNTTERGVHERLHVETVNVGDPDELIRFLERHDLIASAAGHLHWRVGIRMREQAELLEPV